MTSPLFDSPPRRDRHSINSIANGLLLCQKHHATSDAFDFTIHPETHHIIACARRLKALNGLKLVLSLPQTNEVHEEVCNYLKYPYMESDDRIPPSNNVLEVHCLSALSYHMKAGAEPARSLSDDDQNNLASAEMVSPPEAEAEEKSRLLAACRRFGNGRRYTRG